MHLFAGHHLKTHHVLRAISNQRIHFFGTHRQRIAHAVTGLGIVLKVFYLCPFGFKLLRCVEGDVGLAFV